MKRALNQILASMLAMAIAWLSMGVPMANAAMVETDQLITSEHSEHDRAAVLAFLDRQQVQDELLAHGVSPDEAKDRLAQLSDDDVSMLAGHIDQLPAGGFVGAVIGAAVFIFLVLLVTDILGFTDIYPFVHHR